MNGRLENKDLRGDRQGKRGSEKVKSKGVDYLRSGRCAQLQAVNTGFVIFSNQADDLEVMLLVGLEIGLPKVDVKDGKVGRSPKEILVGLLDGV